MAVRSFTEEYLSAKDKLAARSAWAGAAEKAKTSLSQPLPLPTAPAGIRGAQTKTAASLPTAARRPATLPTGADMSAGQSANTTAFDIDPATVGVRRAPSMGLPTGRAAAESASQAPEVQALEQRQQVLDAAIRELRRSGSGVSAFGDNSGKTSHIQKLQGELSQVEEQLTALRGDTSFGHSAAYATERLGSGLLGAAEGVTDLVGAGFFKGLEGVSSLGGNVENPVSKWAGRMADVTLETGPTQAWEKSIEERYKPTDFQRQFTGVEQSVARMLPAVGASMVSGNPMLGKVMMGAQAAGSAAQEAKSEGAGSGRALLYGVSSGLLETVTEGISGGIPGLGKGVVSDVAKKVLSSPVAAKLLDIAGEGGEEALSAILTPYIKRAVYNPDAPNATAEEIAQSAIQGMIAAGVLQGGLELPRAVSSAVSDAKAARQAIGTNEDIVGRVNNRLRMPGQVAADLGERAGWMPAGAETGPVLLSGETGPVSPSAAQGAANGQTEGVDTATAPQAQKTASTGEAVRADTSLFNRSVLQNLNQARKDLISYAREHFPSAVQNTETGKTIKISRNGLDKFLSGRLPFEKYATGFHIPELVEYAHKMGQAADNKGRESITGYEYYQAPVSVDGTDYTAYIRVRNTTSGDSYYGHTIGEVDDIRIEPSARVDAEAAAQPVNAIDDSIDTPIIADSATEGNTQSAPNVEGVSGAEQSGPHIDERTWEDAGKRKVNAFQFDNPQLHQFFADAATGVLYDLNGSTKGERSPTKDADGYITGYTGTKRHTTSAVEMALDDAGLSYDQIRTALQNIIDNHGQENYAAAKKMELVLDTILTEGYTDIDGNEYGPDADYIAAKEQVRAQAEPGAEASAGVSPEDSTGTGEGAGGFGPNTVGSAENPFQSAPKVSKVETNSFERGGIYNEVDKQMAGVKPEDLSYDPVSERQSMSHALDRLVNDFEGEKADLPNKEAWSGEDLDTAMGILYQARQKGKQTGDYSEFNQWRKLIQEKGTNAGQMIQAFAKYTRTPEGILMDAAKTLEKTGLPESKRNAIMGQIESQVDALEGLKSGDLDSLIELIEHNSEIRGTTGLVSKKTGRQMDQALRKIAEKYDDAEAFLRDVAVSQIRSIAADHLPVSPLEAVKNYRVMGMLSKVSTVMRNIVSNNVFDPMESLSNNIATPFDIALSKLTGQRTTTVDKSWASEAKRQGSLEGLLKSYVQVGLDASTENATGRYEGAAGRTFKMTGNLFERLLSTWAKYEGYALNTTDEFQKGGIRAETQRGIDALKESGKLDPKALPTWADETARQRTFQNEGAVAKTMTGLRASANNLSIKDGKGGSFGVGDLMLPFARVPGNLVSQAANYSPLGLANGMKDVVRTVYQAKNGTLTPEMQAQAVRNVGRGLTGSAALAGFGALALAGLLNVAGADDKDKESLERAQGKNGTQWNLSATMRWLNGQGAEWQDGDTLASIGFLEPLNAIMAAGALMADAYREDGTLTAGEVAGSSASATIQAVLDLPAMSSISSLIDAYKYAEGETTAEKAADAALSYGGSQASSFLLPNFVKGIATGMDNTVRSQYSSGSTLGTARDSVVAGLPMFRETLPASVDGFGRERTNTGNTAWNMLNSNFLPGQLQTYKQNAVEKELGRISDSTGAANIYPGKNAPYTVRYDSQSYSLTPEERDTYQRTRGQATAGLMESLVGSKSYLRASDEEKAELLADAVSFGEDVAKREMLTGRGKKYKSGLWEKAYAVTRAGIAFGLYLEYKDLLAERKEAGKASEANAAVRKAIFSDGRLTQTQKEYLDQTMLSDVIVIPKEVNVNYSDPESFAISQMSDGAQKHWPEVKERFGLTPEKYAQAWIIYNKDSKEMSANDKKAALRELTNGEFGNALYDALGKK